MTLDSVRVGKFTVKDVRCAVLPAGLTQAPPLLGGSFLRHFSYRHNPGGGKVTFWKVQTESDERDAGGGAKRDAPDPRP